MAMIRITPLEVSVRTDWFDGRPRSIRIDRASVPVVAVEAVRRESAAHPPETGPRTVFHVRTPEARYRLSYEHLRRRWLVDGLEVGADRLAA
jgi:hypothetical protein